MTFYCLVVRLDNMFRKFMYNLILVQNIWIFHFYRPSFRSSCPRGQASYLIVIGACATREQPFDLLLKPTQIIRGKSNWISPFRDIWLSQRVSSCFPAPGKSWVSFLLDGVPSYRAHKKMVWSQERRWQDCPLTITSGLSLLKASTPRPIQQLAFGGSMEFLSRFSRRNYSFSFTAEHYTLFGATLYTWQLTKVIICPVFLSFCLPFKTRTGLCFCWSLPFLLLTNGQPPLCWRPRKFWTAALFASRDWCKVFKVKTVGFFFPPNRVYQKQDIFMLMRTLLSTVKLSKTKSLDLASLRFTNALETTWKKMVSARTTMRLSLNFILFCFF